MGRLLLGLIACAASGCIDWGSLYEEHDGGSTDTTPDADSPPTALGCSDGTAEALIASAGLAACSGAWSVPGVVTETEPACERAAGNDGSNPSGEGCDVADLCAAGWHVCRGRTDVSVHGGDGACDELGAPNPDGTDAFIYLTRQRGAGETATCAGDDDPESADDAWGCGTLGLEAGDCKPLDRHLALSDGGGCDAPFNCGDDPSAEGLNVTKSEPAQGGGVLCCSDSDP